MRLKCCGICRHNHHQFVDRMDGVCTLNPPQHVPVQTRLSTETWGREWVYPRVSGAQHPCSHYAESAELVSKLDSLNTREEQTK